MIKKIFDLKAARTFFSGLLFFAVFLLCPGIKAANDTHTLINYTAVNVQLNAAVLAVLNQAGVQFNSTLSSTNIKLSATNLVSPTISNVTWSEALEIILQTQNDDNLTPLTYRIVDSQVVLYYQSVYPTTATLVMNFFPRGDGSTSPVSSAITTPVSRTVNQNQPIWKAITATPIAGYHFVNWTGSSTLTFADNFSSSTQIRIDNLTNPAEDVVWNADSTAIAWFEQDDISAGLVAYYPFNGNASDESGNGNDGIVNGATLVADRFGNPNRAYSFDGINDYINCGNDEILNLATFSVSYWVNSDHTPGSGLISNIISKGGNYTSCWDHTTAPKPGIIFNDGTTWHYSNSTSTFIPDKWYHIVATYNKNSLVVYVNGVSNNTVFAGEDPQTNVDPLCIGSSSTFSGFLRGSIDDLRVYNRALAPSEVTKLYKLPATKLTTASSPATAGSATPSPNITVNSGDPVTVTAYPKAGFRFSKWAIGGTSTLEDASAQITTVNVNSNSTATAYFVADSTHNLVSLFNPYPVPPTDQIQVQNAVTQCLKQVGMQYNAANSNINIGPVSTQMITPDIRNALWSEALGKILGPLGLTYKIISSKVVLYRQDQFVGQSTLAMNFTPSGGGITSPSSGPVTTTVTNGNLFDIQALPSANYHFINWTKSFNATITDENSPSTTASVTKDSTITANFAHDTATLTMAKTGNGSTSPALGDTPENTATAIPIVATPNANNHFLNWTVTAGSATLANATLPSTTVTLNGDDGSAATVTANFAHDTATLTVVNNGHGAVVPAPGTYINQNTATPMDITATPDAGYHFVTWAVSGSATVANLADPTTTLTLTGANNSKATLTANFAIDTYQVNFVSGGNGNIAGATTQNINFGSDCTAVTAVPSADYHFANWTGIGGPYAANPLTILNVSSNMTITANFAHNQGMISTDTQGTGSVTIDPAPYYTKTAYGISAIETDPANFNFINWTADDEVIIANPKSALTTVRLTGQEGCSGTVTANFFPVANTLNSGDVKNFSGDWKSKTVYRINVPAGITKLVATTANGDGDCDLYVRPLVIPSIDEYYSKSTNIGTAESITVRNPTEGYWYILVYGYALYSNIDLTVTLDNDLPGVPELLTATSKPDRVTLTWNSGAGATSYDIYRSRNNSFNMATLLPAGAGIAALTFDDVTALVGTSYYYWVVSRKGAATSAPSNFLIGSLDELLPIPLKNGVAITKIAADAGTTRIYQIIIPASPVQALLEIEASIGSGDGDMTVTDSRGAIKYGVKITNNEIVRIENPPASETYTIFLYANTAYSGVTLMAKVYSATPLSPTGLAASDGTYPDAILVSWKESAGATIYEVWRAEGVIGGVTPKSSDAEKLSETSDCSFFDNINLDVGKVYYYWVKAKNPPPGGTSAFSTGGSGYVSNIPGKPTSFTGSAGTYFDKIRLTWPKVAGATSYLLYRNSVDAIPVAPIVEVPYVSYNTTYTYDDMGGADPKPNTGKSKYYYWIKAKNNNGTSDEKQTTGYVKGTGPTGVSASKGTFFDQVKITWTAVPGASSYNVYSSLTNDPTTAGDPIGTSETNSYYDKSVSGTTTVHYYWVKAYCGYLSAFSTSSSGYAKTSVTTLTAPAIKSVSNGAYSYVYLTWAEAPLAVSYNVYRKINTADPWGDKINGVDVTNLFFSDNTADPGKKYLYAVTSVNGVLESSKSASKTGYAAGASTQISDGETIEDLSGRKGNEQLFRISNVPENRTRLVAKAENLNPGDSCDIYAKLDSYPTTTLYTAKGTLIPGTKADKSLTVTNPASGTWFILICGSGTNGYTKADLTVSYYSATNIILTQVPQDDLAIPFTATFKGKLQDESNTGIPGFNIGVRDPVTGLQTWLPAKTDANGLFTYSTTISGEGEYTYDFFLTTIPDYTRTIGSWTVKTRRSPEANGFFDFAGYIPATPITLSTGDPDNLAGMQNFLSIRRGFKNGPVLLNSTYSNMWVESTIVKTSTDANILAKLDTGLYLLLYGTEGAAAGNGKTVNPALTVSPLLVHVASDKLDTVLGNLKTVNLIDNELADNVLRGGIGVIAISSFYNPDETGVDFDCDVAMFADEQLEFLANIADGNATFSTAKKYGDSVLTMDAVVPLESGRKIGTRITSFMKEYIPAP